MTTSTVAASVTVPSAVVVSTPEPLLEPVTTVAHTVTPTSVPATTLQSNTSHVRVGVVERAVISSIAALVLLTVIILGFKWYRQRYNICRSSAFSSGNLGAVSSRPEITHEVPMAETGWQQLQSRLPVTAATDADVHDPDSLPSGLHAKSPTSVPVGLSDKELAQMRAENLRSRPTIDTVAVIPVQESQDASGSQSSSSPATGAEQREPPTLLPMFRTLQSQVDRLWREMRQLRAERLGSEAPPTYTSAEHDESTMYNTTMVEVRSLDLAVQYDRSQGGRLRRLSLGAKWV